MKRILFLSPKGGSGKTTMARNVAVAAVMTGRRVATFDLDRQRGLTKWWDRRPDDRPALDHYQGMMGEVTEPPTPPDPVDLLVIDTPPSVEEYPEATKLLILSADLTIMPCQPTQDDVDSTIEAIPFLRSTGRPFVVVLNRVKPRVRETAKFRRDLVKARANLYPIDIPELTDLHRSASLGLGVIEIAGIRAGQEIEALWSHLEPMLWGEAT